MNHLSVLRLLAVLMVLSFAIVSFAQTDSARLTGTITDAQGAVVAGATITLTNTGTGRVLTAQSGGAGEYTFPALQPGQYKVEVKQGNFKTVTQEITLQVTQVAGLNFQLQPGTVTESVEVTSDVPLVESASSNVSEVIQGRQVTELPLNGRNFTQLATLVPGVTRGVLNGHTSGASGDAETFRYGNTGGASLSVNGLRAQANNFLLDGVDNNESLVNTIVFFPPAEAIQEFRVDTSVAQAEFGRAGGGVVNSSFKSGTNTWHGSGFEFLRNNVLDARRYFDSAKPAFKRNQFGGQIGGSVIKNKLFVFADYQGLRQNSPKPIDRTTVPTDLMRQGNFTEISTIVRNPLTGQQFSDNGVLNVIPQAFLNPAGLAYLNAFPEPNCGPGTSDPDPLCGGPGSTNYKSQRQEIQRFDDFDVRVDYNIRTQDTMFGRFSYGKDHSLVTSQLAPTLPAGWGSGDNINWPRSFVLGETHTFGNNLINEFRFGFVRVKFGYEPPYASEPLSANLGIVNANTSPLLGGGALIGANDISWTGDYGSYLVPENTFQYSDTMSWIKGKHTIKFGADIIRRQVNLFRPKFGKGEFIFNGVATGYDVADMLAGFANHYEVGPALGMVGTRSWETGYFVQDDIKVTPRLTLNLGLRYDLMTWPIEVHDWQANFDVATGTMLLAGKDGNSRSLIPTDKNNFAPRVGFAYDLTGNGKMVLRAGYGLFYFPDRGGIDNQLAQNMPFGGSVGYDYGNGYRFTFTGQGPSNDNNPANATGEMPSKGIAPFFPPNSTAFAALPTNRNSYVQQWNVQIQRELSSNMVATLGYVGTKSDNLIRYYNMNRQAYNAALGTRATFPASTVGDLYVQDASGTSDYNSLQAQLEKRLSNGLQFTAAYTWSHTIDDAPDAFDGSRDTTDFQNLALERANSSLDVRHRFVFSTLYELPFGRGKAFGGSWSGPIQAILGGWQTNGILTLQSGSPFDVTLDWQGNPNHLRPDVVGDPYQAGTIAANPNCVAPAQLGGTQYFNPCAFVAPPVSTIDSNVYARAGNLPRNFLTGPGTHTFDLSVFKNFKVTERVTTQFRTQFYNLTNTPQFAQPSSNAASWNNQFGQLNNVRYGSERQIEFALRISF